MVIQAQGDVQLEREGARSRARVADLLYPGDRIAASAGKATILFCPSSQRTEIPQNSSVEVSAGALKVLRGSPTHAAGARCVLPKVALGAEDMERVGAVRARPGYKPIALYTGGLLSQTRPVFRWAAVPDAASYHLIVRSATEDETIVWERRTSDLEAAYPDAQPPLRAGEYQWDLMAAGGGKILAQGTATLTVRPAADLPGGAEVPPPVRAVALENAGYYAEAAEIYRALRERDPEDGRLTRRLAWLYWNSGLLTAAGEELRRLEGSGR